jgi:nicotinamide-nucleotide amidase
VNRKEEKETMSRSESIHCEILTIGAELLLGQIMDTNGTYLAQEMGKTGIGVRFRTTAGDRLDDMELVFREALKRCDFIICTGGLGPTEDDLTRQAVANVAGVELVFQQDLMVQIEEMFASTGYTMPENNRRQAFIPEGSHPIPNPVGTAPGFIKEIHGRPVICLPGVPRELRYLLKETVIPWIRNRYHLEDQVLLNRVLKVVGIGESRVDSMIADLIQDGNNPIIGLLSSPGEIKIRLTASADDSEKAGALIQPVEKLIRERLGEKIYGVDGETFEGVIHKMLVKQGLSLAVLETFTGGKAALGLHKIPSKKVKCSLVVPQWDVLKEQFKFDDGRPRLEAAAQSLASIIRKEGDADVALISLGFPEEGEKGFSIKAYNLAKGDTFETVFCWEMGGKMPLLQQRGAVIALNTLRLGLLQGSP